jgi:hypothetical protein
VLDLLVHQNLRRFAIWYVLARQTPIKYAPFGAFCILTHQFTHRMDFVVAGCATGASRK